MNKDKMITEKTNSQVNLVSKELQIPYDTAYALMQCFREDYDISFVDFVRHRLHQCGHKEIEAVAEGIAARNKKKKENAIKNVMRATGWTWEEAEAHLRHVKEVFGYASQPYLQHRLYKMTDKQIEEFMSFRDSQRKRRMKAVTAASGWTKQQVRKHMAYCEKQYHIMNLEYYAHCRCWTLSDEELGRLAVNWDSRMLSRHYNQLKTAIDGKLSFHRKFDAFTGRKYWVNRVTTFEKFLQATEGLDRMICNPLHLDYGVKEKLIKIPDSLEEKRKLYRQLMRSERLLAEEVILQHDEMNRVYGGCINTVCLTMLKKDEVCHRLWALVHFGGPARKKHIDRGDMVAAVNVETGVVMTDAMNDKGKFFQQHPTTGVAFQGFQLPHWDTIKKLTEDALRAQQDIGYIGWEIAICPDKAVLLGATPIPKVAQYQLVMGSAGQKDLYAEYLSM